MGGHLAVAGGGDWEGSFRTVRLLLLLVVMRTLLDMLLLLLLLMPLLSLRATPPLMLMMLLPRRPLVMELSTLLSLAFARGNFEAGEGTVSFPTAPPLSVEVSPEALRAWEDERVLLT